MTTSQAVGVFLLLLLVGVGAVSAGDGSGSVSLGYVAVDAEGDQSAYYRSFNDYEGVSLSLEDMRYRLNNGVRLAADLRNLTLNNRNLRLGVDRPGNFGVNLFNNRHRQVYSGDGGSQVSRNRSGGSAWFYPHESIRIYGGATSVKRKGESVELFQFGPSVRPTENTRVSHDYTQLFYHGGVRLSHRGGQFQVEYRTNKYSDNIDSDRNQSRHNIRLSAVSPVPGCEMFAVHGGYQRFTSEFEDIEFRIESNIAWAGLSFNHPVGVTLRYSLIFNSAGSDSDAVKTDNVSHAAYAGYSRLKTGGATVGYQLDKKDDANDRIDANSAYVSGWLTPVGGLTLRANYGNRNEGVKEGVRLVGDEERSRFRASVKYQQPKLGWASVKYEDKRRENSQIGTSVDFVRTLVDGFLRHDQVGTLSIGYAYSRGDYVNVDDAGAFEFRDHLFYGDITVQDFYGISVGFGGTYYRSRRDLDVESFTVRLSGSCRIMETHLLEITYNTREFDDYIASNRDFTSNIVEVTLVKSLTF